MPYRYPAKPIIPSIDTLATDAELAAEATSRANAIAALNTALDGKSDKSAAPTETIFEAIAPVVAARVFPLNGAVTSQTAGSKLVNEGRSHNAYRTSTPPDIFYSTTDTIPSPFTPSKLRWAIQNTKTGLTSITIDSSAPLTANGDGTAWTSNDAALVVRTDGLWSWFEYELPANGTNTSVTVRTPTGLVCLPSLYPLDAPTETAIPSGVKIKTPTGQSFDYRPGDLVTTQNLATAIAALDIEETESISVAWGQTLDIPTVMPDDGLYRFSVTGITPSASDAWWGFANAPVGSTISRDGEVTQFGGSTNSFTVWGGADVTIVREENTFTVSTEGMRIWQNARFSANVSASSAFSGSGEFLAGMRPSRWMAKNEGTIIWNQGSGGTTFQSILNVWNSTVHPPKTEYQITTLNYNGAAVTLTDTLPAGLTAASWRSGLLSLQSLSPAPVAPALPNPTLTQANAGVAVAVGDRLRVQISTSGNRSLQISASTPTNVTATWNAWHSVADGVVNNVVTGQVLTNTAWVYINSGLNFSQQCQTQSAIVRDTTNNRRWRVDCNIGSSYVSNLFTVQELAA